ncbi:MAG: tyrosine-type recombinase/integrase [Gammaproteobacteria bacterium]|nr:tyrosine-type recombinase/integrase [Gammaproteobacteria bacterium]
MRRPQRLSTSFVKTVNVPGRYGDRRGGHGLSLLVKPMRAGGFSKSWSQRVLINGRPTNIGLGAYPVVSLADARRAVIANRRAIARGLDPRAGGVPTFEEAAEKVIAMHEPTWKNGARSAAIWRSSLRDYAMPSLGRKTVDTITTTDVMAVLVPIWSTKRETARRVRQRIGAVMKWSVAHRYRQDNPAGDAIAEALPRDSTAAKVHHRALPHAEVGAAVETIRASGAYRSTVLAFEFLVLTASRSGEVRGARWEEVDFDAVTWTVPASRMKIARPHRVPLSTRAVEILGEAQDLSNDTDLVFPSPTGRMLSDSTISKLVRENGIKCVPHGMRSSFRDWAAECSEAPREVCELALAHVNSDRVEAAYRRSDLFERRRELMEDWATYLAPPPVDT